MLNEKKVLTETLEKVKEHEESIANLNSNLSSLGSKIAGNIKIYGFSNKLHVTIRNISSNNYYGYARVYTQYGSKEILLVGYDGTSTDISGTIKTYKHKTDNTCDFQFVFPDRYTHGLLLVGGACVNGTYIDGEQ